MSLKQKAISGVKWNTTATVVLTLFQVLRLAVLTRLLDKSDFGLIAIATMVIGFTDIFSELGLTVAVIHKQDISDKQYSSVFWTNIILSIIVFFVLWGLTPLLSVFYKEPRLNTIIPLFGIQILMNGFGKMFQTIKSKNLEYAFLSKVRIAASLFGFIVTVIFALLDYGVYSLVIGQLCQVALMQGIYTIVGRKEQTILWHLDFKEISDFIKIGTFRLGSQVLDFVSSKIDIFLIGKFFGMDDLGIYNLAKDLICRPFGIINQFTSSVASSAFAQIQKDLESVRTYYKKILSIISSIAVPIYIIVFIAADFIVRILYGPNFGEVAILLRILTIYGIECSVSSQGSIIQVALGRTDVGFKWTFVRIIFTVGVILAVSSMSIQAVAYGQSFLSVISFYLFWILAIKPIVNISFLEYINTFKKPLLVSIVSSLPICLLVYLFRGNIYCQIFGAVLFTIIVLAYYWITQKELIRHYRQLIFKR